MNDHATMMSGWLRPGETREDEESDEEAVEDTPVTGATDEHAELLRTFSQRAGISSATEQWGDISERRKNQWRSLVNAMANDGYAIVRAEDALTAEDRDAISAVCHWIAMEEMSTRWYEENATVLDRALIRLRAIAAGGQG